VSRKSDAKVQPSSKLTKYFSKKIYYLTYIKNWMVEKWSFLPKMGQKWSKTANRVMSTINS